MLENQGDNLLAFTVQLDRDLEHLAQKLARSVRRKTAREVLDVQCLPTRGAQSEVVLVEATLRETLQGRYHGVLLPTRGNYLTGLCEPAVWSKNLNSRLRTYFFLRRQLGKGYLTLLQFFLNHRRYLRSEDPSRVDKSPAGVTDGVSGTHIGWNFWGTPGFRKTKAAACHANQIAA